MKIMPREFYKEEIKRLEPGLPRAVLSVMRLHVGLENAIGKGNLIEEMKRMGFLRKITLVSAERKTREVIKRLRREGYLICSSSGEGGYYLASNWKEYDEFIQIEYRGKIIDMAETVRAMDKTAPRVLGRRPNAAQEPLFGDDLP